MFKKQIGSKLIQAHCYFIFHIHPSSFIEKSLALVTWRLILGPQKPEGRGREWLTTDLCPGLSPNVTPDFNGVLDILVGFFFIYANKSPSST